MRIVATPDQLDASDGWWRSDRLTHGGDPNAADKWLRPVGYVKEEAKRKLRRDRKPAKVKLQLPRPTLAGESKRLAKAVLVGEGFCGTGPRAAEEFVRHRRRELGLTLELQTAEEVEV